MQLDPTQRQPYRYNSSLRFQERALQHAPLKKRYLLIRIVIFAIIIIAVIGAAIYGLNHHAKQAATVSKTMTTSTSSSQTTIASSGKSAPAAAPLPNECAKNTLTQNVVVSISKQHLWACAGTLSKYDSAVVTGMESYPADLTPVGSYHVYDKQTNIHLKGCDNTGCWDDPVSYWMPWLDNSYGQYGFHDASWRDPSQFGKVNIYAPDTAAVVGSHGCVELPTATAKWLYNWVSVGTTVTIEG